MVFNLWQTLGPIMHTAGTATTTYQQIDNLHKFILDNVPYGHVDPTYVQQGIIEIDGPAQEPRNAKKPLQWYFNGVPYPIIKAIRVQYTYTKAYQGSDVDITGNLFIGYDDLRPLVDETLDSFGIARTATSVPQSSSKAQVDPVLSREDENIVRGAIELRKQLKPLEDALVTAQQGLLKPRRTITTQNLADLARNELINQATTVTRVAHDAKDLNEFIPKSYPYGPIEQPDWEKALGKREDNTTPEQLMVEYDGPAQNYDSFQAFPFTLATLFSDQEKWNQLLWWYFGGRVWRISKAMRVHWKHRKGIDECLWMGFSGPNDLGSGGG